MAEIRIVNPDALGKPLGQSSHLTRVTASEFVFIAGRVAAPGVSVPAQGRDGQYWSVSGTSPACALVAGVAALIKSRYPGLAPDLVATALTTTTTYRPPGGYDSQVGF